MERKRKSFLFLQPFLPQHKITGKGSDILSNGLSQPRLVEDKGNPYFGVDLFDFYILSALYKHLVSAIRKCGEQCLGFVSRIISSLVTRPIFFSCFRAAPHSLWKFPG